MRLEEYVDENGRNAYAVWFRGLSPEAADKAYGAVTRMSAGNTSGLKPLSGGLAEWRIDWGPGLRIYVHQEGEQLIVLMGGSDKGDQSVEIVKAKALVKEYKKRKKKAKDEAKKAAKASKAKAKRKKRG
jgi:putative addiction module killer protein